jgi:molybdate transport system regulatory protein
LLPGRIVAVEHGEVMSTVKIDIGSDQVLTAAITKESAQDLDLEAGVPVTALIKATNVAVWAP